MQPKMFLPTVAPAPALVIAFLALACPAATAEPEVTRGIPYAVNGGEELKLDLAIPAGDEALRPAILFIHGGGWREGNRGAYAGAIVEAARRGFVGATASYRFAPRHPWPAQLEDVRAALGWLRANAGKYRIDPRRIGATGHSAGGHLSLMLGLAPARETDRLAAVVNFFGPTDMTAENFNPVVEGLLRDLAGGSRGVKAAAFRDFSPIAHITPGDAPVLTFHGTKDPLVPVEQARALHKALEAARIPNRLEVLEGRGHGWGGEDEARTSRMSAEFFETYLRGSSLPLVAWDDFDGGADRWEPTDAAAWKVESRGESRFYSLAKRQSAYSPPVRSPYNIALLRGAEVGDFVLDVLAESTIADYPHRDLCVIFGWRDPSHFYYAHIARTSDPHANSIFIVNGEPRRSIAEKRTEGTDWTSGWHRVRVRREVSSGKIEVYFDDLSKPIFEAADRAFPAGRVGIGSFDDTGNFDEVRLRGKQ